MFLYLLPALSPVSGDEAVVAVRRRLVDFGYREPVRLSKLVRTQTPEGSGREYWNVELKAKSGTVFGYVRVDSGRVIGLAVPGRTRRYIPSKAADPGYRKRGQELVDRVREKRPVRFHSLSNNHQGTVSVAYSLLIDGYPFLSSYSQAGYAVSFDAETKAFRSFSAMDEPPPIDPRPARIKRGVAEAKIRTVVHQTLIPELRRVGATVGKVTFSPLEFGYYLVTGERQARRVWRGEVRMDVAHPGRTFYGGRVVILDAITGERVVPQGY